MEAIDRLHRLRTHRSTASGASETNVGLAVCEDKRSEVPGIFNKLTESILGWDEMIAKLHERGVHKISLVYADRLKGLEAVGSGAFPGTQLQRCTTPRIDSDRELYP